MRQLDTESIRRKREKLEAELEALRSAERSADDMKSTIVGRAILDHARNDPAYHQELMRILDSLVTKRKERIILGLPVTEKHRRRKSETGETTEVMEVAPVSIRDEPAS
jgi:hypothetical protein